MSELVLVSESSHEARTWISAIERRKQLLKHNEQNPAEQHTWQRSNVRVNIPIPFLAATNEYASPSTPATPATPDRDVITPFSCPAIVTFIVSLPARSRASRLRQQAVVRQIEARRSVAQDESKSRQGKCCIVIISVRLS